MMGTQPFCGTSRCESFGAVVEWVHTKHEKRWRLHPGLRISRMFLQSPLSGVASNVLSLSRSVSSQVIGLTTGHSHLRKHLYRVDILWEYPFCRMCDGQEKRYVIFGSLDKGGEFPQEDLIGCFRQIKRLKCIAIGHPIEEEEEDLFSQSLTWSNEAPQYWMKLKAVL
ncbi:hypothetical protein J6590_093903 [Homalodisca vitripennis]|nr:hypothetical protein J6590_093903 [Homalodisca vitripennis]